MTTVFNRFRKSFRPPTPPSPASFYSPGHIPSKESRDTVNQLDDRDLPEIEFFVPSGEQFDRPGQSTSASGSKGLKLTLGLGVREDTSFQQDVLSQLGLKATNSPATSLKQHGAITGFSGRERSHKRETSVSNVTSKTTMKEKERERKGAKATTTTPVTPKASTSASAIPPVIDVTRTKRKKDVVADDEQPVPLPSRRPPPPPIRVPKMTGRVEKVTTTAPIVPSMPMSGKPSLKESINLTIKTDNLALVPPPPVAAPMYKTHSSTSLASKHTDSSSTTTSTTTDARQQSWATPSPPKIPPNPLLAHLPNKGRPSPSSSHSSEDIGTQTNMSLLQMQEMLRTATGTGMKGDLQSTWESLVKASGHIQHGGPSSSGTPGLTRQDSATLPSSENPFSFLGIERSKSRGRAGRGRSATVDDAMAAVPTPSSATLLRRKNSKNSFKNSPLSAPVAQDEVPPLPDLGLLHLKRVDSAKKLRRDSRVIGGIVQTSQLPLQREHKSLRRSMSDGSIYTPLSSLGHGTDLDEDSISPTSMENRTFPFRSSRPHRISTILEGLASAGLPPDGFTSSNGDPTPVTGESASPGKKASTIASVAIEEFPIVLSGNSELGHGSGLMRSDSLTTGESMPQAHGQGRQNVPETAALFSAGLDGGQEIVMPNGRPIWGVVSPPLGTGSSNDKTSPGLMVGLMPPPPPSAVSVGSSSGSSMAVIDMVWDLNHSNAPGSSAGLTTPNTMNDGEHSADSTLHGTQVQIQRKVKEGDKTESPGGSQTQFQRSPVERLPSPGPIRLPLGMNLSERRPSAPTYSSSSTIMSPDELRRPSLPNHTHSYTTGSERAPLLPIGGKASPGGSLLEDKMQGLTRATDLPAKSPLTGLQAASMMRTNSSPAVASGAESSGSMSANRLSRPREGAPFIVPPPILVHGSSPATEQPPILRVRNGAGLLGGKQQRARSGSTPNPPTPAATSRDRSYFDAGQENGQYALAWDKEDKDRLNDDMFPETPNSFSPLPSLDRNASIGSTRRGSVRLSRSNSLVTRPVGPRPVPANRRMSITKPHVRGTSDSSFGSLSGGVPPSPFTPPPHKPVTPTPMTPKFNTLPMQWRGLTLDAAKWTLTSHQLQDIVGRAIRASSHASSIRILPPYVLDVELPAEVEQLEQRRDEVKQKYKAQVRRRKVLLRSLGLYADGSDPVTAQRLTDELNESSIICDQLCEELYQVTEKLSHVAHLRDAHDSSALAMALRKLNSSLMRKADENSMLRARLTSLEGERDDAWNLAQNLEDELEKAIILREETEDFTATMPETAESSASKQRRSSSGRVSQARKNSVRTSKSSLRWSKRSTRSSIGSSIHHHGLHSRPPSEAMPPVPPIPAAGLTVNTDIPAPPDTAISSITDSALEENELEQAQEEQMVMHMLGIRTSLLGRRDENARPRSMEVDIQDLPDPVSVASSPQSPVFALDSPSFGAAATHNLSRRHSLSVITPSDPLFKIPPIPNNQI